MKSLPLDVQLYRQTPVFTEASIPSGLLTQHQTKSGVWARIQIIEGKLRYEIAARGDGETASNDVETHQLYPGFDGIIEPGRVHRIDVIGKVKFFLSFYRSTELSDEI